jgi:putative ABC transport system permease protein
MSLLKLILREIAHRRQNFWLATAAIAVAALSLVAAEVLLLRDAEVTDRWLELKGNQVRQALGQRAADVERAGAALEEATRKQMLELGFNILILPEGQDLAQLHLSGAMSATMPESYVDRLAQSNIVTVNHLLPSVVSRIEWPEQQIEILLQGTRGEVPIMHRDMKKPLLDAVEPGKMVVGYEIHRRLSLEVGQSVELLGRSFTVSKLHPQRGSVDDTTVWIDLRQAQEMLGLENLIHAILALECECAGDRLARIRAEIQEILPGTQVMERYSQALTRAESRTMAKRMADEALERERQAGERMLQQEQAARQQLEDKHAQLASVLVPLAILLAGLLVGLLAYSNVVQRRHEIGLWRALGLGSRQIMVVFLGKAALIGLLGGLLGLAAGLLSGAALASRLSSPVIEQGSAEPMLAATTVAVDGSGERPAAAADRGATVPKTPANNEAASKPEAAKAWDASLSGWQLLGQPRIQQLVLICPLLAIGLGVVASWLAATLAVRQDAALILQGE